MGYLKKQRNLVRIIADPIVAACTLAGGMWIKSKLQCDTLAEHLLLNTGIVNFSILFSLAADKFIRDVYKARAEYGYTPRGIKKYILDKKGNTVDIIEGNDLQIRCYEKDL